MSLKLYTLRDGPPSIATMMALKALNIPHELVDVNWEKGEHRTDEYAKINPQKEIPALDDNGFYLAESTAIMQYICDKYAPDSALYPADAKQRAVVNHRLCFNTNFLYPKIVTYLFLPMFYETRRQEADLRKLHDAVATLDVYIGQTGGKYAAGTELTIADFALVAALLPLVAFNFDFSKYKAVHGWLENFKEKSSELYKLGEPLLASCPGYETQGLDFSKPEFQI